MYFPVCILWKVRTVIALFKNDRFALLDQRNCLVWLSSNQNWLKPFLFFSLKSENDHFLVILWASLELFNDQSISLGMILTVSKLSLCHSKTYRLMIPSCQLMLCHRFNQKSTVGLFNDIVLSIVAVSLIQSTKYCCLQVFKDTVLLLWKRGSTSI